MDREIDAVRAPKKMNVPVVMTREEVASVISLMDGTAQLVARLFYRSGLRIREGVWFRGKNLDFQMKQFIVRSGKGDEDRFTTVPTTLTPLLQDHLSRVCAPHEQGVVHGHDEVYLPHALARKNPQSSRERGGQDVPSLLDALGV